MDTQDTGSIDTGHVVHRHHDETRHHFSEILDEIRNGMVEMGSLVVENARRASVALVENRLEMVQGIIDADKEVNQRYAELERLTFETLARQQPVAKDLRFLVSLWPRYSRYRGFHTWLQSVPGSLLRGAT